MKPNSAYVTHLTKIFLGPAVCKGYQQDRVNADSVDPDQMTA